MNDSPKRCAIAGCSRDYFRAGYCNAHYKRKWRHGDPLAGRTPDGTPIKDRLLAFSDRSGECWLWTGGKDAMGYGTIIVSRRSVRAHRASYEAFVGPIPGGLDIDHLCRVKACVNPSHLEPVTHSENLRRHYATITTCPRGHAYDEANTYRDTAGKRRCRTCMRERQRARRAMRR